MEFSLFYENNNCLENYLVVNSYFVHTNLCLNLILMTENSYCSSWFIHGYFAISKPTLKYIFYRLI